MQGPQIRGSGRAQSLHDIWEESLDMQRQRRRSELSVDTAHPSAPSSAANQWIGSPAVDSRWRSPASDPLRSHPGSAERQGSVDEDPPTLHQDLERRRAAIDDRYEQARRACRQVHAKSGTARNGRYAVDRRG